MLKHWVGQQYTKQPKLSTGSSGRLNSAVEFTKHFRSLDLITTWWDGNDIIILFWYGSNLREDEKLTQIT